MLTFLWHPLLSQLISSIDVKKYCVFQVQRHVGFEGSSDKSSLKCMSEHYGHGVCERDLTAAFLHAGLEHNETWDAMDGPFILFCTSISACLLIPFGQHESKVAGNLFN
jgi:uncharacterized protein YcgI (DUF1989 family)